MCGIILADLERDTSLVEFDRMLAQRVRGKAWRSEGGSNAMYYGRYFSNQVVVGEKVSQTLGTLGI